MKLSDFDFHLPDHLIAQTPAPERDRSRMMVVWRQDGRREHHIFRELPDILDSEHFLVVNNTRVFPARLNASRPGKQEEIEILLLRESSHNEWLALVKPAKKTPPGQRLTIGGLPAQVMGSTEAGGRIIRFEADQSVRPALERMGTPPIPPYIRRSDDHDWKEDRVRYQTVYAQHSGSIAAPTAGLHFTEETFRRLKERNIPVCEVLLHVGYGTFQPVRCEEIEEHRLEPEYYEVSADTAARIRTLRTERRKLVAVGTTTTRCLEFLGRRSDPFEHASAGWCNMFIYPGFEFRMLNGLLTNFHLPQSTLFMLASAFAGRELLLDCYREAIANEYRFYSYGDCMLIL